MSNGLDLFTRNAYKDILVDSLEFCQKEKGIEIYAWCAARYGDEVTDAIVYVDQGAYLFTKTNTGAAVKVAEVVEEGGEVVLKDMRWAADFYNAAEDGALGRVLYYLDGVKVKAPDGSISVHNLKFVEAVGSKGVFVKQVDEGEGLANAGSDWFSLSSFKNITAKIPGGVNNTNIGKTLWNDAYKITPTNGSSAKNVVDDIIANGDNLGTKTEGLVDDIMTGQGYQIADGKYFGTNGVNGYDGIYYKGSIDNPSELIIIESKQMSPSGSASLSGPNGNTGLPSQMSDNWIDYVATNKLDGLGGLKQQTADAILDASDGFIQKYVVAVDKTAGEINFLKLGNF